MSKSDSPKIYAGMLKRELLDVARRLGLQGTSRLRKADLVKQIQTALRRPKKGDAEESETASGSKASAVESKGTVKKGAKATKGAPPVVEKKSGQPSKTTKTPQRTKARSKAASTPAKSASAPAGKRPKPEASPQPESFELSDQSKVTAAKYGRYSPFPEEDLRHVDSSLPGLPDGYGEDRIVLLPRDPEWLFAYWDIRNETKDEARRHGGVSLALRLYEQIDGRLEPMTEHWVQEYARAWYLRVPSPGQTYVVEIGYRDVEGGWMGLLRSNVISVPPSGPSPIIADQFVTIMPDEPLEPSLSKGRQLRGSPTDGSSRRGRRAGAAKAGDPHEAAYQASLGQHGAIAPGSAPGAMAGPAPTSPTGAIPWSGSAALQAGAQSSEVADKGFWLIAEAELVVFGATDPKATLSVGGQKIRLRGDGTFSVRMAFPDGTFELPIEAVAEDGEQRRGLKMRFERATGQIEARTGDQ